MIKVNGYSAKIPRINGIEKFGALVPYGFQGLGLQPFLKVNVTLTLSEVILRFDN